MKINKELKNRWTSESPEIFKKITNICTLLGLASFGILAMNGIVNLEQWVDPRIFKISSYMLVACGAMGLTSKITQK